MTDKNIIEGALNGNKECCYILGEKYYYGRGTGKNTELAKEWYGEAARLGHARTVASSREGWHAVRSLLRR